MIFFLKRKGCIDFAAQPYKDFDSIRNLNKTTLEVLCNTSTNLKISGDPLRSLSTATQSMYFPLQVFGYTGLSFLVLLDVNE